MEVDGEYHHAINHQISWPRPGTDWNSHRGRSWIPPHPSSVPPCEEDDEERVLYERARAWEAS
eukprot:85327-Heterocapsa_arctica.AAC.1